MNRFLLSGCLIICFFLFRSCAVNPVTGKKDLMLISKDQEIAMGRESDPEIVSYFGLYKNDALQKFIQDRGEQMASISHRKELKYEFKIVDSPVVNAFAVPGGYVYFTRGIMAHFNNEAEFAGVLGHEIGHITARHSARQYSRAMLAQVGLVAGMVLYPDLAQFGEAAQTGISLLFLKFDRDAESQSDKLGVEYSTKIGYDAREMADFFNTLDRLQKQSGAEEVPDFLSTHPNPQDRKAKVTRMAADWKRKVKATGLNVNRDRYLRMIDGLVYGEDPQQGYVENNTFYHPVLRFQFPIPRQWNFQNTPEQVQMAASDGRAFMLLRLAQGSSLEGAAETLLKNYQLTVVESKKDNVNGLPAIVLVADQKQEQQTIRTLIYVIQHGNNMYSLIGASSAAEFRNFLPTFQGTMENFAPLNDADKLNKQPEHVRVKTVQQNGSLAQALRNHQVSEKRMEEIAILNGMILSEQVAKGMLIKVIE